MLIKYDTIEQLAILRTLNGMTAKQAGYSVAGYIERYTLDQLRALVKTERLKRQHLQDLAPYGAGDKPARDATGFATLSVRARKILNKLEIRTIDELANTGLVALSRIRNCGVRTLFEYGDLLASRNTSFVDMRHNQTPFHTVYFASGELTTENGDPTNETV